MTSDTILEARPSNRQRSASGRFVLRIDPTLHESLRKAARAEGMSLNRYCARRLASPDAPLGPPAAAVVRRATSLLGDSLLGVVAFGSWVRGDASSTSDVDILLVAHDSVAISRDLYRQWDDQPALNWNRHQVSPHFVHLPLETDAVSGLWAEVAVDGLVLFEQEHVVSRRLAGVRRRIVEGRVSLRLARGQPYWVREPRRTGQGGQ